MDNHAPDIFPLMLIRTAGLPLQWPANSNDSPDWSDIDFIDASDRLHAAASAARSAFEQEKDHLLSDDRLQKITTNTRRRLRQEIGNTFILIDPYLRAQRPDLAHLVDNLNQEIEKQQTILTKIRGMYAERMVEEHKRIIQYAGNQTIRHSLLFSSHSLLHDLPALAISNPVDWHKKERKTAAALLRYVVRASTKTTPFSRLATVSLQYLDRAPSDSDEMASVFSTAKHIVTPNVALLPALYDMLLRDPAFFSTLGIRLNPSVQTSAGRYEWLYFNGEQEGFQHIYKSTVLEIIQTFFEQHEKTVRFCDLTAALADEMEDKEDDIQSFVFQLIDYGWIEWIWPEKGLSAGWCGSLYNYLGFLPASSLLTDAAYLLQWLRTTARSISFQSVAEAREAQLEALSQCRTFFERYGGICPEIPPEHIFYEDVESPVQAQLPAEIVQKVTAELDEALQRAAPYRISGLRAELILFGQELLGEGESMPFLSFSRLFLEQKERNKATEKFYDQLHLEKIGALVQFFKTETGEYGAVLNGLFPGGGKMMARWLHLFPAGVKEQLQNWWPDEVLSFPWQDWTNANFQPVFAREGLTVPGGRVGAEQNISLRDLLVCKEADGLQLREKTQGRRIVFSDLGLEDPNGRPPVIQILWHLGVPFISAGIFTDQAEWTVLQEGVRWRKRLEYQSLVLGRAAWLVSQQVWQSHLGNTSTEDVELFMAIRTMLSNWGVPRFFFAGSKNEKTRFFDQNSPMLMQDFCKMIQRQVKEEIYLSEMLPTPEQWLAEFDGEGRAAEWALEFRSER